MKRSHRVILWILDKLPGCMHELTGCKYICPRYWILERLKAERAWNKILWITCAKEIRKRLEDDRGLKYDLPKTDS